jgi:hypothetical protein
MDEPMPSRTTPYSNSDASSPALPQRWLHAQYFRRIFQPGAIIILPVVLSMDIYKSIAAPAGCQLAVFDSILILTRLSPFFRLINIQVLKFQVRVDALAGDF